VNSNQDLTPEELMFIREIRRRKCSVCGRLFTLSSDSQKYCSKSCKDKARQERYGKVTIV
jgi:predicted nucleic acid-binding Zn ribbon protein